jgi:SNF2 family DNA or RNA helicase
MHMPQAVIYRKLADELFAALPDGDVIATTDGSALRTALRRVTAGVPLAPGLHDGDPGLLSAKHDAAMDAIEASGDSQWVVFGWHKRTVRELARRCAAANIPCGVIDGDVSHSSREHVLSLFKQGGYRVLVATIATLSQAANLQNASCVGMLEESDDPVQNEQAVGRVVRQGQTAHASVFRWRIEGSVDDLDVSSNALSKAELRRMILGT